MKKIICIAFLAMILFSCNQSNKKPFVTETQSQEPEQKKTALAEKEEDKQIAKDSSTHVSSHEPPPPKAANLDWDKKIIKTAEVTLELKDFNSYNKSIHQGLKAYGAYVAAEEQTQNDNATENNITIKVPVDRFDDLMNSFSGDGIKVTQRKISTEDVTGEVVDTKGRMETKKQVREQYMQLLKQAKNMKDILEVQSEINGITEEVEAAGSRVQYLTHQAAYSTIHLKYFQYTNGIKPVDEEPGFLTKLKEAFKSGGSAIANLLLLLISIWPVMAIVITGWIMFKKRKKNGVVANQETMA